MCTQKKPMLIFDLDGTLWDSAENVAVSWNMIFQKEDPSLPLLTADDIHGVMGLTMREIQDVLQPGLVSERRDEVFAKCNRFEVEYLLEHGGTLYPSLRETLEILHAQGYPMAIVSNCQCGYINAFLKSSGVAALFQDFEEWERTGLPKGENIRLVMERNHAARAIYIGDTRKDQEAAQLAGIPFIHAAYGFGAVSEPEGVIHHLSDLPAEVSRLLEQDAVSPADPSHP